MPPNALPTIRLMLVDDHSLVRDGLRARLQTVARIEIVGEAGSGREALGLIDALRPDLMLIDIGMKDMNGIQLTAAVRARYPDLRVLILSMYDNAEYVNGAVRAGANGYVTKDADSREIIAAIEAVATGNGYFSGAIAQVLAEQHAAGDLLTERERAVLILLARGLSNKAIAQQLNISVRTVETHRLNLRSKLRIDSPAALVKYALDRGWVI